MTVKYRFSSMASLADFYANRASQLRATAKDQKPRRRDVLMAEASAFESVADMLRNTTIEEEKTHE